MALLDAQGTPLGRAEVDVRFYRLGASGERILKGEAKALFLGGGELATAEALYSARTTFDEIGAWEVEATVIKDGGGPLVASAEIAVRPRGDVPSVGSLVPLSENETLADAPIEQLTSERPPGGPEFYRLTIAEAVRDARPFMVVFSTPAFCQTRTCGPQLETAQALERLYGGRMSFIHIEIFDRPDLVLAEQAEGLVRWTAQEWHLESEPWVFLVDGHGKVFDRFEGFAPLAELEPAVRALLGLT